MDDNERNALDDLFAVTGIPFVIIDSDLSYVTSIPFDFRVFYAQDYLRLLFGFIEKSMHSEGILLYCAGGFYYTAITHVGQNRYIVTAPISAESVAGRSSFSHIQWCITKGKMEHFFQFFMELPVLGNYQLARYAGLAKQICTGHSVNDISIVYRNDHTNTEHTETVHEIELISKRQQKHRPLRWKKAWFDAVKLGDEDRFKQLYNEPAIGLIGRKSLDDLQQAKFSYVSFISVMNWAVIDEGLPYEDILQLSDDYCQRMDRMNSVNSISRFKLKTGIDYCRKVMQYKGYDSYRAVTRRCSEYIKDHLYKKFSVSDLSSVANLNRRSLALYFRQDTGWSISEYITFKRLEEAKFLMANTEQSLSQISLLLQFSSQSYFGRKYKEIYGQTPQQFRDSLK